MSGTARWRGCEGLKRAGLRGRGSKPHRDADPAAAASSRKLVLDLFSFTEKRQSAGATPRPPALVSTPPFLPTPQCSLQGPLQGPARTPRRPPLLRLGGVGTGQWPAGCPPLGRPLSRGLDGAVALEDLGVGAFSQATPLLAGPSSPLIPTNWPLGRWRTLYFSEFSLSVFSSQFLLITSRSFFSLLSLPSTAAAMPLGGCPWLVWPQFSSAPSSALSSVCFDGSHGGSRPP